MKANDQVLFENFVWVIRRTKIYSQQPLKSLCQPLLTLHMTLPKHFEKYLF